MPNLRRTRDGAGDSGGMSEIVRINPETDELEILHNEKPRIGWAIKVGSNFARSYSGQDWWMTTPVTEILEEKDNYIKFKTGNSEYEYSY